MSYCQEIKKIALDLLNRNPDPAPSFIIIRDLLETPRDHSLSTEAEQKLLNTKWVKELETTQEANGTWGRFHTRNSSIKAKFPTTEITINRALELGLDGQNDILGKSVSYMTRVLNGKDFWIDRVENFNEWPETTRMITAAVLSRIDKFHPDLDNVWALWARIAGLALKSGQYSLADELSAFEEVTGICPTSKDSKLNRMYPLQLLGSSHYKMPAEIERAYLEWVWHNRDGIYYLTLFSMDILPDISSKQFPFWLRALEMFANYDYGRRLIENAMDYIWSLRKDNGLWDLGAGSQALNGAKIHRGWNISGSWKEPINRQIDCTIRILLLFKKYYAGMRQLEGEENEQQVYGGEYGY